MLNLERCKTILNKGTKKFSNEEIKKIREYLYQLADIEFSLVNSNLTS